MKLHRIFLTTLVLVALVATFASCAAENQPSSSARSVSSNNSTDESSTVKNNFVTPDACQLMPKEEIEKIIGEKVASTAPAESGGDENTPAVFTSCRYEFSGDRNLTFFVRRSHDADTTPNDIEKVREMSAEMKAPTENVAELGGEAFWTTAPVEVMNMKMYTLHAFKDGDLFLYTMFKNPPSAANAKQQAIKILQAAFAKL